MIPLSLPARHLNSHGSPFPRKNEVESGGNHILEQEEDSKQKKDMVFGGKEVLHTTTMGGGGSGQPAPLSRMT
jgi:hypothetical protein